MNDMRRDYQMVQDALRWRRRVEVALWFLGSVLVAGGALAGWWLGRL